MYTTSSTTAPRFKRDGTVFSRRGSTVLHNGRAGSGIHAEDSPADTA